MLTIINDGQTINETNFWQTELAENGFFFLSWNAGAARLLVPKSQENNLKEMQTGKEMIISRGLLLPQKRQCYELLFEDYSASPYALHLSIEQSDRTVMSCKSAGIFNFFVFTEKGKVLELPAKYRIVEDLPCLQSWSTH